MCYALYAYVQSDCFELAFCCGQVESVRGWALCWGTDNVPESQFRFIDGAKGVRSIYPSLVKKGQRSVPLDRAKRGRSV